MCNYYKNNIMEKLYLLIIACIGTSIIFCFSIGIFYILNIKKKYIQFLKELTLDCLILFVSISAITGIIALLNNINL